MITRFFVPLVVPLAVLSASLSPAQDTPAPVATEPPTAALHPDLAQERWRESAYGLSFLPPDGATKLENAADGTLVRFTFAGDSVMSLVIRQNLADGLDLATLKQHMKTEVSYGSRQANMLSDDVIRPAGRPGTITYFEIEQKGKVAEAGEVWVFGQAVMKIDPHTVAVFQLRSSVAGYERSRAIFEASLNSIEMASPDELDRVRKAWVAAGVRWHDGVTRAAILASLVTDQWYRVVEGDRDVGYSRVRHSLGEALGFPGVRVEVQSRIVIAGNAFDTESFFFLSDDRLTEMWSVRTAQRPLREKAGLPGNIPGRAPDLFEETGLRSGDMITVTRNLPGKINDLSWKKPQEGYLSQAELQLLLPLLPRDEQRDLAFYAYSSATGDLTLHKFSIYPGEAGGYIVRLRPSPDQGEQVMTFNAAGQLQRRDMADGRSYLPTTPEEMKRIWGIR